MQEKNRVLHRCQVIIPIYHPDEKFIALLKSLQTQICSNFSVMIIDSGSDGMYRQYLDGLRTTVKTIDSHDFNHGGTRQQAMDTCEDDICVYLTQDAILADEQTIGNLLSVFSDERIGCAFGRQLPHKDAGFFARFARSFNYGENSYVRGFKDKEKYGIKTVFISNSFAAYRRIAMQDIGGFATDVILSEDMYAAARMLLKGWKVAYQADACVHHSHDYGICQEFRRNFDIGVFQSRESWIGRTFGKAEGEGVRFVHSELNYLLHECPQLIPSMFIRDLMKLLGFMLGYRERCLPRILKEHLSFNRAFWQ